MKIFSNKQINTPVDDFLDSYLQSRKYLERYGSEDAIYDVKLLTRLIKKYKKNVYMFINRKSNGYSVIYYTDKDNNKLRFVYYPDIDYEENRLGDVRDKLLFFINHLRKKQYDKSKVFNI